MSQPSGRALRGALWGAAGGGGGQRCTRAGPPWPVGVYPPKRNQDRVGEGLPKVLRLPHCYGTWLSPLRLHSCSRLCLLTLSTSADSFSQSLNTQLLILCFRKLPVHLFWARCLLGGPRAPSQICQCPSTLCDTCPSSHPCAYRMVTPEGRGHVWSILSSPCRAQVWHTGDAE